MDNDEKNTTFQINGILVKASVGKSYIPNVPPFVEIKIPRTTSYENDVKTVLQMIERIHENERLRIIVEQRFNFWGTISKQPEQAGLIYQMIQEAKIKI